MLYYLGTVTNNFCRSGIYVQVSEYFVCHAIQKVAKLFTVEYLTIVCEEQNLFTLHN